MRLWAKTWGISVVLLAIACVSMAGAQAKGTIKIVTSWPMQGAMIPEGTAMKQAVDLAVKHAGGEVAGFKIEVVNQDDASPMTRSWDGTVEADIAQKTVGDPESIGNSNGILALAPRERNSGARLGQAGRAHCALPASGAGLDTFVLSGPCEDNHRPGTLRSAGVLEMVGRRDAIGHGCRRCFPTGAPSWPWRKVLPIKRC